MNISKKIILLLFNLIIFIILIMKMLKILPIHNQNKIKVFLGVKIWKHWGTLTKIKKLKLFYGESLFSFNIIYLMSNTPYLSRLNIFLIKKLKYQLYIIKMVYFIHLGIKVIFIKKFRNI